MHFFEYRDGVLHAEGSSLPALAREVETPFYVYSAATIRRHFNVFSRAVADLDALVCYAMKANSNQAVLKLLAGMGAGMDVVSEGELLRARAAGVASEKITFSGVGKTDREIALALDMGIFCFNVESEPELANIARIAAARGAVAPVSLRVNPDVDARTHAKISTGKSENKFGVPISAAADVYDRAAGLSGVKSHWRGHAHRLADHRSRAVRQRLRAACGVRRRLAAARPRASSCRSRRRPGNSLFRAGHARKLPIPSSMPRS